MCQPSSAPWRGAGASARRPRPRPAPVPAARERADRPLAAGLATLMARLVEHGQERHAPPSGQLLRYRNGRRITSRYDGLWARIGRVLPALARPERRVSESDGPVRFSQRLSADHLVLELHEYEH
jgi:hypothetical protein